MRKIYFPDNEPYIDWMGFPITEENKPIYHHIEKKADLKKQKKEAYASVENGAYLGKHSHELLHHIEIFDKDLYDAWNYIFLVINKMKCYPIPVVWDMIHDLQRQTEELFQKDSKTLRKLRKETAKRNEKVARPFAIYNDGKMVGFTMFAFDKDYEDPDDRSWLWRLMIAEGFQGKGYGTAALQVIIQYFKNHGANNIRLSTKDTNASALSLYHKAGFRDTGEMNDEEIVLQLDL